MNSEVLALVVYFIAMLSVGVFFFIKSKNKTDKDYFLGGRKMGPWVTALSAQASDMSAWLLMGLPGSILAFGLGQAWIGIGLALGTALNWILIAKRLRRFSQAANDSITLPQYLSNRFATQSKALQVVCAVVFLVCFTLYVASAFVAGTNVFTALFDIKPETAMLIFALILIVYTFLGGYRAVCWTDLFQGMLMIIAILAVPIIIALTKDLDYSALENVVHSAKDGTAYSFVGDLFSAPPAEIASGLAWGLGYFGMPHILVRFMSIEKPKMVKRSATIAIIWVVLALVAVIILAVMGRVLIGEELLTADRQSMVFIELARDLFPGFIAGILLSAVIAASMSTADSQLLVASSSFTSDIYKPILRKNASDKETLWVGRGIVLIVAVIAYFIASSKAEGAQAIMNLVENAWAGFGSAFGPVVILSLFWRRFTYKGALAGVIVGALTDVLWLVFLSSSTGIYELIPGFAAGMLAAVVVTLLDKAPSDKVTAIFDEATAKDAE
ncbi:MAG: sodium/proline symporter PutP [Ruminococcaceae bacterium]|nr:sodium/proline symporter PutP [Oscillospiraceae bacterium]